MDQLSKFHLTVLLKPYFNFFNSFAFPELIKLRLEHNVYISSFKLFFPVAEERTQSSHQVKIRSPHKLMKYFNGNAIVTPFVSPLTGVFPCYFNLGFE